MKGFKRWEREWLRRRGNSRSRTILHWTTYKRLMKETWYRAAVIAERLSHFPEEEKKK